MSEKELESKPDECYQISEHSGCQNNESPHAYEEIDNKLNGILETLIAMKTVSGDDQHIEKNQEENKKALLWIQKQLEPYLKVKIFEDQGVYSLVASPTDPEYKYPTVSLMAHNDVVNGSDQVFSPRKDEQNTKIIGRGAIDMKFATACYIRLVQELEEEAKNYDFNIILTSDEEIGGEHGVKALVESGYVPKLIFLPDGANNWGIQDGSKGNLAIDFTAKGTPGHASTPWVGDNAINNLMDFLVDLQEQFPCPRERCDIKDHFHHTMNIGQITGGTARNSIPAKATAQVSIRYCPNATKDDIDSIIQSVQKKYAQIEQKLIFHDPAFTINLDYPEIQYYKKCIKDLIGKDLEPITATGMCDATFFIGKDTKILISRPIGGDNHSELEWIDQRSLSQFYQVMKRWFLHVAQK
jgi:succinyl-diaminopimelate desuccinylase